LITLLKIFYNAETCCNKINSATSHTLFSSTLLLLLLTVFLSQGEVLRKVTGCDSFLRTSFQCGVCEYSFLHTNGSLLAK